MWGVGRAGVEGEAVMETLQDVLCMMPMADVLPSLELG